MARSGTSRNSRGPVNPFQLSAHNGARNVLGRNHSESTSDEDEVLEDLDQYQYHSRQAYGGGAGPFPITQVMHPDFARDAVGIPSPIWVLPPSRVHSPRHNVRHNPRQGHGGTLTPRSDKSTEEPPEPETKQEPEPEPPESHSTPLSPLALFLGITLDQLPRQIYLYLHLRITALYWSRVSRTLQDARTNMRGIKGAAMGTARFSEHDRLLMEKGNLPYSSSNSVPWARLRALWNDFITSLIAEWSTLNIISALLLSAILAILQIESAMAWPLARFSALLSLVCAFMSLLYGCIYIIRFSTMRRTAKAAEWALKSQTRRTAIFWNVYVMLSLPSVWLGWAMIFFIVSVMSMVWQTGTTADSVTPELTFHEALGPRMVVSCVLALGLLYLALVAGTVEQYGDAMDEAWKARVKSWAEQIKVEGNKPMATVVPVRAGHPVHGGPVILGHDGYSNPTHDQEGFPNTQIPLIGEPRPVVPFIDAPAPGLGRGSVASRDLYQERYRTTPSIASQTTLGYAHKVDPPKLPLPPSDDRVFREREYIDMQVSRRLSQVTPNDANEEQGPIPPDPEDDDPRPAWRSGGGPEDPGLFPPPPNDSDNGNRDKGGAQKLEIPDSHTEPGDLKRVPGWLGGVNLERSSTPGYKRHYQHGETTWVNATQRVPEENVGSTSSETRQAKPKEPTHADPFYLSPSPSPSIHEDQIPHYAASASSPTSTPEPHENEFKTQAQPNGPALQLTPMNGLQSTVNMRLGAYRLPPCPELGAQGFAREGKPVKILQLQATRASAEESPAHGPNPPVVAPEGIPPQVWRTFTLDVLSAWSNLGYGHSVSVNCEWGQLWWSPQKHHDLLNFIALVDMWNNLVFQASGTRLIVLGIDGASGARAEVPNRRQIEFGVYMAPLDLNPLVVDVEGSGESVSFIRFYCDWVGGARMRTEPDVYIRGAQSSVAAEGKLPEGV